MGAAVSGGDANRRRETAMGQAEGFSQLPTQQLRRYVQERPNDVWAPYIRAIIQARGSVSSTGANPEGAPATTTRPQTNTGAFGTATHNPNNGYGLSNLTTAELNALANDPQLMQQWMAGGGQVQTSQSTAR